MYERAKQFYFMQFAGDNPWQWQLHLGQGTIVLL